MIFWWFENLVGIRVLGVLRSFGWFGDMVDLRV